MAVSTSGPGESSGRLPVTRRGRLGSVQTYTIPRPTTALTVGWMVQMAKAGATDMRVRRLAEEIVRGITPKDYLAEGLAVGRWVEANVQYRRDIAGVETLQTPAQVLESRVGDCDDLATLIGALLIALGHRVAFVTVAFGSGEWSHVFVQFIDTRTGRWIVLDPVAAPDVRGMLRRVRRYRIYPV